MNDPTEPFPLSISTQRAPSATMSKIQLPNRIADFVCVIGVAADEPEPSQPHPLRRQQTRQASVSTFSCTGAGGCGLCLYCLVLVSSEPRAHACAQYRCSCLGFSCQLCVFLCLVLCAALCSDPLSGHLLPSHSALLCSLLSALCCHLPSAGRRSSLAAVRKPSVLQRFPAADHADAEFPKEIPIVRRIILVFSSRLLVAKVQRGNSWPKYPYWLSFHVFILISPFAIVASKNDDQQTHTRAVLLSARLGRRLRLAAAGVHLLFRAHRIQRRARVLRRAALLGGGRHHRRLGGRHVGQSINSTPSRANTCSHRAVFHPQPFNKLFRISSLRRNIPCLLR